MPLQKEIKITYKNGSMPQQNDSINKTKNGGTFRPLSPSSSSEGEASSDQGRGRRVTRKTVTTKKTVVETTTSSSSSSSRTRSSSSKRESGGGGGMSAIRRRLVTSMFGGDGVGVGKEEDVEKKEERGRARRQSDFVRRDAPIPSTSTNPNPSPTSLPPRSKSMYAVSTPSPRPPTTHHPPRSRHPRDSGLGGEDEMDSATDATYEDGLEDILAAAAGGEYLDDGRGQRQRRVVAEERIVRLDCRDPNNEDLLRFHEVATSPKGTLQSRRSSGKQERHLPIEIATMTDVGSADDSSSATEPSTASTVVMVHSNNKSYSNKDNSSKENSSSKNYSKDAAKSNGAVPKMSSFTPTKFTLKSPMEAEINSSVNDDAFNRPYRDSFRDRRRFEFLFGSSNKSDEKEKSKTLPSKKKQNGFTVKEREVPSFVSPMSSPEPTYASISPRSLDTSRIPFADDETEEEEPKPVKRDSYSPSKPKTETPRVKMPEIGKSKSTVVNRGTYPEVTRIKTPEATRVKSPELTRVKSPELVTRATEEFQYRRVREKMPEELCRAEPVTVRAEKSPAKSPKVVNIPVKKADDEEWPKRILVVHHREASAERVSPRKMSERVVTREWSVGMSSRATQTEMINWRNVAMSGRSRLQTYRDSFGFQQAHFDLV